MATHDYDLANQSGAAFRTDLNNALSAIATNNSNSSDPSTHNGVVVEISETNYYVSNVSIISQTDENMPQENGSTYILMGHYTLDNYGVPSSSRWFLEGPVWAHKHPRVVDSTTSAEDRTEPPAPINPSDLSLSNLHDIPGYVETG